MIQGFHHVVLFCKDTEVSKDWYERVGFVYKRGYEGMHWFALGDGEIMLHPGGPGVDSGTVGLPALHVAVTELDTLFKHVKEDGLQPFDHQSPGGLLEAPVVRPWGDREFELTDPDGHRWAFTEVREA